MVAVSAHPEWVTPQGTTVLEPRDNPMLPDWGDVKGEWQAHGGDFRLPYAAGIAGQVRFIYIPTGVGMEYVALDMTVLKLEPEVRYHAYYWDPTLGIRFDLGDIMRPTSGKVIGADTFEKPGARSGAINVAQRNGCTDVYTPHTNCYRFSKG
jgi:hypothetical protein